MITIDEKLWLQDNYPLLKVNENLNEIKGTVSFVAGYDKLNNQFSVFRLKRETVSYPGKVISGTFQIIIKPAVGPDRLPSLQLIESNIKLIDDRHFSYTGKACLCGPADESQYIDAGFVVYLEHLVIPFLYSQCFYDENGQWPWETYAHGATGIFESYLRSGNGNDLTTCLDQLKNDPAWKRIKSLLESKKTIKGGTRCFCKNGDLIRRCHPDAFKGINKMKSDIRIQGLNI